MSCLLLSLLFIIYSYHYPVNRVPKCLVHTLQGILANARTQHANRQVHTCKHMGTQMVALGCAVGRIPVADKTQILSVPSGFQLQSLSLQVVCTSLRLSVSLQQDEESSIFLMFDDTRLGCLTFAILAPDAVEEGLLRWPQSW